MPVMSDRRPRVQLKPRGKPDISKEDTSSTPSPPRGKTDLKSKSSRLSGGTETGRGSTDKLYTAPDAKSSGTRTGSKNTAKDGRRGRRELSSDSSSSSSDSSPEVPSSGRIKNLAGFWAAPKDVVVRKTRLEVAERSEKVDDHDESDDELDGAMKTQENTSEKEKPIEIEKGMTKSIANMWQKRKEDSTPVKKAPFKLDIKMEEQAVFENEPVVLEGVARGEDRPKKEEIVSKPGRIKDLAESFTAISHSKAEDSDDEIEEAEKTTDQVIECGRIRNVRERWKKRQEKSSSRAAGRRSDSDSDGDSTPTDEIPQRHSRGATRDQVFEQAKIKNLRERFTRTQEPEGDDSKKPTRAHAIVAAKEYGVFENEPIVRDDVVRADDEQPDVISCEKTKKLRKMWTMMEKGKMKDSKQTEQPPTATVEKPKKQEAEEVTKSPATKSKKGSSDRTQGHVEAQKQKDERKVSKASREHESGTKDGSSGRTQGHVEVQKQKDERKVSKASRELESGTKDKQTTEGRGKLNKTQSVAVAPESPGKSSAPKSPPLTRISARKKLF